VVLSLWGLTMIALGGATSEWALRAYGALEQTGSFAWLRVLEGCVVGWGIVTIVLRHRLLVLKLNLMLFSLLVVTPVVAELALRVSLLFEGSPTRRPELYADYFSDDDYWKLNLRWTGRWAPVARRVHPLLGWSQANVTEQNPLGLYAKTSKRLDDKRRKVAFYGDSFVAGSAAVADHIPEYMERQLGESVVLDFAVPGYGTDQIALMFQQTYKSMGDPFVVIGTMLYDLDRAVLSVRGGLKPYVEVDAQGRVQLEGVPIPRDQLALLLSAPLDSFSFLMSFIRTKHRKLWHIEPRLDQKKRVNTAILEWTKATASVAGLDVLHVIFYGEPSLHRLEWREDYLKGELERLGLDYVDTKPLLLEHCRRQGKPVNSLYTLDGHHNAEGNRLIGDAIVAYLRAHGIR